MPQFPISNHTTLNYPLIMLSHYVCEISHEVPVLLAFQMGSLATDG